MNGSDHAWGGSPWSSHEAYCEPVFTRILPYIEYKMMWGKHDL